MNHTAYLISQQDLTPAPTHDDRAYSMQRNFRLCYGFVGDHHASGPFCEPHTFEQLLAAELQGDK